MNAVLQSTPTAPHHFGLNATINLIAGNGPLGPDDVDAWCAVGVRQCDLILDELTELYHDGLLAVDAHAMRSELADVIVTLDGLLFRMTLPPPPVVSDVFEDYAPITDVHNRLKDCVQRFKELLVGEGRDPHEILSSYEMIHQAYRHAYQMAARWDVDIEADQMAMFESNMSKFDADLEIAQQGVAKFKSIGVEVSILDSVVGGKKYYVLKSTVNQTGQDGKDYPAGKFLKSINYKKPVFPTA